MKKNQDYRYVLQNKEAYDAVSHLFSSTRDYLWDDLKKLGRFIKNGDTILDVGCGNGRLSMLFSDKDISYTGVDQSENLITLARSRYEDKTFVVEDICTLSFLDNSFDALYAVAVICHIPPQLQKQVIKEMFRVLRPGGCFIMTNWNAFNGWVQDKVTKGKYTTEDQKNFIVPWRNGPGEILAKRYYYGYSLEELNDLASSVGFIVEDQYYAKKGKRVEIDTGENIISIWKK
ncbi:MAG: class I SAM-dependent methyltransferase [Candidatus Magasanikbacteria bacterium]|jgi:ubiquinone/menaquinone biosynthesis C-methylase UbiE|nr:class I SAM-dependent methyltransferase [Candidatus Magasanikbacteria bacterium]MBT4221441.1 class I SAM-dependent methyltransferase [Candidatus Magasanikbacteria bacterium]MBT4350711.1 class I SAM-dependent methyltransferase [Candidatus Magasanikbacteria bacterium]MBT4541613.1 class I SAM-dependent methyltransferase [Candidatus Magasanikbacteria bacterium]MBT6252944.1 class I SAM-dependent methyltransferase [Candidatus Magasanikbacteria bacterium]